MKKLFTLFLLLCTFFAASAQSIQELTRRAQNGDAVAQYNLGLTYYEGKGVTKNYVEAAKWFRKAADQGFAEAQYAIGMMYVHGEGVSKNAVEGVKWYRKAAEQGFADAQYNLGYMYVHGEGVSKNLIEAAKWYRKAAEQGQAEAQYCLGSMYYEGLGVTKNLVEAVKWWRKAAEQGDVDAQYNLGLMYYAGEGVQQNKTEGIKWLRKAADQGDINAKTYLELISKDNNNKPSTSQTKNTTSTTTTKPSTAAQTSVPSKSDGTINGHEYVDLGLSVKWATCNVGASRPEAIGQYFSWGETTVKPNVHAYNRKIVDKSDAWLRSNGYIDAAGNLNLSLDAANKAWGASWRIPTKAEIEELIDNTTTKWYTHNGVCGRLVTSKINGKSIFIPANDKRTQTTLEHGSYWTSTPAASEGIHGLYFYPSTNFDGFKCGWSPRTVSHPIRPVISSQPSASAKPQTAVASKTDGTKGQTWKDFEGKGLDLIYFVSNGNRGEVAGETWTLLNFNLSDHKTDVYVCGQLRDAFSHGKATLSGNRLTITYDNNDTNVITINRYDAANSTLYTSDSHGCERAFKVRKAKRWKDFSNKHLYLKYWRKGKANGTVKGEMLTYSPEQAGSSWVNYTWSGMEEGTQVGTGHMSDYLIRLKTKNTPKPKETYLYLAGFNAAQNILYAYDPNTQIIRAFTVK